MKKVFILILFTVYSLSLFAQNAESDFTIDENGIITKYEGWGTEVVIPARIKGIVVRGIGDKVFQNLELTKVTIPNTVTSIGWEAFSGNKLTSITIPGNNVSIGKEAFANNQLSSLNITGNGVIIREGAFKNNYLASASITGNDVIYESKVFEDNRLASITLGKNHELRPDTISGDFWGRQGLKSLFYDYVCNDRKAGTYVANIAVTENRIGDYSYVESANAACITQYHGSASRIIIPDKLGGLPVKVISGFRHTIGGSHERNQIQIPDSVTYISYRAFASNGLTGSVIIPNCVTHIGNFAFHGNTLTNVIIPNSVIYIGEEAFSQNDLRDLTIPNSVIHIGKKAFYDNKFTSITIPNSITHISEGAFCNNYELASVILPNSVTHIGEQAFGFDRSADSTKLTSVIIPNNVTHIGAGAFPSNLISITIGANVTIDGGLYGFASVYNDGGKKAGTYTRPYATPSSVWTRR